MIVAPRPNLPTPPPQFVVVSLWRCTSRMKAASCERRVKSKLVPVHSEVRWLFVYFIFESILNALHVYIESASVGHLLFCRSLFGFHSSMCLCFLGKHAHVLFRTEIHVDIGCAMLCSHVFTWWKYLFCNTIDSSVMLLRRVASHLRASWTVASRPSFRWRNVPLISWQWIDWPCHTWWPVIIDADRDCSFATWRPGMWISLSKCFNCMRVRRYIVREVTAAVTITLYDKIACCAYSVQSMVAYWVEGITLDQFWVEFF